MPPAPQPHDLSRLAQDLQIRKAQVEAVVQMLDDGNTVPFITRYRKERTGGLNEDAIRRIQFRVADLRNLAARKQTILKSIAGQGKLTDELTAAILDADVPRRLEDLYLPFKPKKRSLATEAKEKGWEPLAQAIWNRDAAVADLPAVLAGMIDPDVSFTTPDDILTGVKHILAEVIAEWTAVRAAVRAFAWDTGILTTKKVEGLAEEKGKEFRDYFEFQEPVRAIPPHRTLAINRGERENVLKGKVQIDPAKAKEISTFQLPLEGHPHRDYLLTVVGDAVDRLLLPSLEREIRRELTDRAQDHAVHVFARNLRSLLLGPPLRGKRVLAVDPGIRSGCKLAVMDETGVLLEHDVVYPLAPQKKVAEAKLKLEYLIRKYQTSVVAIGNGTGCRDTEHLVAELIAAFADRRLNPPPANIPPEPPVTSSAPNVNAPEPAAGESPPPTVDAAFPATVFSAPVMMDEATVVGSPMMIGDPSAVVTPAAGEATAVVATATPTAPVPPPAAPAPPPAPTIDLTGLPDPPEQLAYVIVNEAGASDYSASPVAKDEFPNLDATTRGTISIGRRLQDPLAELVKIDPQHVGVGLYQHDVRPKHLKETLEAVVESCVNHVGVDVNTAGVPLLRFVSGLNALAARELVEFRAKHGPFATREQLKSVPQLGEARFTQAAGFLKFPAGEEPLDATWVHPESYPIARQILADLGFVPADLRDKTRHDEFREKVKDVVPGEVAARLAVGEPTVWDILDALVRPGLDPRDDLPPPIFKTGVLKMEDLSPGMELKGTVLNVVPFGAFVDIGVKESGLVHISQMANRYIKSPYDVVAVGDVVVVWVMEVKPAEKKISLSMMQPGVERKPPERREVAPPRPQEPRPPRPPRPQPQGGPSPRPAGPGMAPRAPAGPPRQGRFAQPGAWRKGPQQQPAGTPAPAGEGPQPAAATPPPRKPSKPKPIVKLTTDKKEGKAALNTFGELFAFFNTRDEPEPAKTPDAPAAPPSPEAPAPPPTDPPAAPPA
ncbi:MAG TPA: Tex family protein [Fimbriiglobus sp.]